MEKQIKQYIERLWWLWVGVAAVTLVFGLVALIWPEFIVRAVAVIVAALVMVAGFMQIGRGLERTKARADWWTSVVVGLILFALGIYLVKNFTTTVIIFALVIGWIFIIRGLMDLAIALFVDADGGTWWKISAIAGLLAGVIMIIFPIGSATTFTWVIGLYALLSGGIMLMRAWQFRQSVTRTVRPKKR